MHQTISHSLLLITDGTDDRISAIDNSASRELQLSIINSKFPCKNLFHRKCVFLLHDQFDGRKKQKCVCYFYVFLCFFFIQKKEDTQICEIWSQKLEFLGMAR